MKRTLLGIGNGILALVIFVIIIMSASTITEMYAEDGVPAIFFMVVTFGLLIVFAWSGIGFGVNRPDREIVFASFFGITLAVLFPIIIVWGGGIFIRALILMLPVFGLLLANMYITHDAIQNMK